MSEPDTPALENLSCDPAAPAPSEFDIQSPVSFSASVPGDLAPAPLWSESDIQGMATSPGPVSFSVSVPGDPAEMLPSYLDNLDAFDKKMETLGMKRSVTQFNTPANGNCGPEGIYPN